MPPARQTPPRNRSRGRRHRDVDPDGRRAPASQRGNRGLTGEHELSSPVGAAGEATLVVVLSARPGTDPAPCFAHRGDLATGSACQSGPWSDHLCSSGGYSDRAESNAPGGAASPGPAWGRCRAQPGERAPAGAGRICASVALVGGAARPQAGKHPLPGHGLVPDPESLRQRLDHLVPRAGRHRDGSTGPRRGRHVGTPRATRPQLICTDAPRHTERALVVRCSAPDQMWPCVSARPGAAPGSRKSGLPADRPLREASAARRPLGQPSGTGRRERR